MSGMSDETTQDEAQTDDGSTTIKVSQEELNLASAQENQAYLEGQLGWLQNRVGILRIQVNRLTLEGAQKDMLIESLQTELTESKKKKPAQRQAQTRRRTS